MNVRKATQHWPARDTESAKKLPLHGMRIEHYGLIGDLETAALVSREGSIDWLCWPNFSSGACLAALLGTRENGFWKIAPARGLRSTKRRYLPQTVVLETTMETATGSVQLIDFMPQRGEHSRVVRIVRGLRGKVEMKMELAVRFDYGRTVPWVTYRDGALRAIAGPDMVVLHAPTELKPKGYMTESNFTVRAGEELTFCLTNASSLDGVPKPVEAATSLKETVQFWTEWMGKSVYRGPYQEVVDRSLMTLKALTYRPSGGIVAAPTTSLPERIGGERNWDYRYCWLRDTSFTLLALMQAGFEEEAVAWRRWLLRAIAGTPGNVQALYGICGERQMAEWEADWLPGYEGSKPVKIGNAAAGQFQLDLYGEVSVALLRTPPPEGDIHLDAQELEARLVDQLCRVWEQPDEGIWEVRNGREQFVHSKVMAWVALDRAIRQHERYDGSGDVKRWRKNRDLIRQQVLEKGYDASRNTFTQSYGSQALDAANLRLALVGFLPADDPRIVGTVEAIERHLSRDGLIERYDTNMTRDGLTGKEGTFLACSFWMASNLYLLGRKDDAHALFERLIGLTNDLGLISEEYDPEEKRMLGNFPQALSHIALVHTALVLSGMWKPMAASRD